MASNNAAGAGAGTAVSSLRRLAASVTDDICLAPARASYAKSVRKAAADFAALEPTLAITSDTLDKTHDKMRTLGRQALKWHDSKSAADELLVKLDGCLERAPHPQ